MENNKDFEANVETFDTSTMTEEEKQEFLQGTPTRGEVANFVEHFFTDQVSPQLLDYINLKTNLVSSQSAIALSILIKAGLISQEDVNILIDKHKKEVEQSIARGNLK